MVFRGAMEEGLVTLTGTITNFLWRLSCCQAQMDLSLFQVKSKQLRMGKALISISVGTCLSTAQTCNMQQSSYKVQMDTDEARWTTFLRNVLCLMKAYFAQNVRVTVHCVAMPAEAGQQPLNLFVTVWPQSSLSSLSTNWWLRGYWIVVDRPRRRNDDTLTPWSSEQMICYLGLWPDHYQWMMDVNCWVSKKKGIRKVSMLSRKRYLPIWPIFLCQKG